MMLKRAHSHDHPLTSPRTHPGGTTPYAAHSNPEYINYIESGQRLQRPHRCDHEVYSMMMNMWNAKPEGRPTFSNLYERLCNLVDKYNELEQIQDF